MATSVAKRSPAKHAATPSAEIIPSAIRVRQMGIRYSRGNLPMAENRRVCTFPILLKSRYIHERTRLFVHRFGAQWRVNEGQKGHQLSALRANSLRIRTGNFLRPCRELNRANGEMFSLIRESALVRFFGICFADKCDRPDRPRLCREGEEGAARMLEAAEADLAIEAGFLSERRARHSRKFGRQVVDANKRRFRASPWRRRSCRSPPDLPSSTKAAGPNPFGHAHDAAGCI